MINEEQYKLELAKTAPENHRSYDGTNVWCPWAYKVVPIVYNFNEWPTCDGCMRVVDLPKSKQIGFMH